MSEERKTWLEKLIGKGKAAHTREDLAQTAAALDKAGIQRKQADSETTPAAPPKDNPATQIAAKLAEQIWAAIGGDPAQLTPEKLTAIIASVLAEATGEAEAEMHGEEDEEHVMEDKAKKPAARSPIEAAQADLIHQLVSDQGEIVKALKELTAEGAALKDLAPLVRTLTGRLETLEAQFGDRPRRASEDDKNIVKPGTKEAAKVESEIKAGLKGGDSTVLGVRVKS